MLVLGHVLGTKNYKLNPAQINVKRSIFIDIIEFIKRKDLMFDWNQ